MTNKLLYLISILGIILGSCSYRSSVMMRTGVNYDYTAKKDTVIDYEYRIKPNDYLDFRLYTNDGFKLIDLSTLNENVNISSSRIFTEYLVEHDGNIKLPLIGRVNIKGMTIKELQKYLEEKYSRFYIDPFVLAKVVNRRVIVFTGEGGSGTVINLINNNTTLIEGLALAGGIGSRAKARKIKLIRGNPQNPEVYLIDLATIDGMKNADFVLQANDIIYVEPRVSISREFTADVAPLVGLASSIITLLVVLNLNQTN